MKAGVPEFNVCLFRIVMPSKVTNPLISISFVTVSMLSAIRLITPAFFLILSGWSTFVSPFTFIFL